MRERIVLGLHGAAASFESEEREKKYKFYGFCEDVKQFMINIDCIFDKSTKVY